MKKTKKIVSLLLTLCLLLSAIPLMTFTASAESYSVNFTCTGIAKTINISVGDKVQIFILDGVRTLASITSAAQKETLTNADFTGSIVNAGIKLKFTISASVASPSISAVAVISNDIGYAILSNNFALQTTSTTTCNFAAPTGLTAYPAAYDITNDTNYDARETNGGYIDISSESAVENDNITVTAYPSNGYELETLKYNDGTDHTLTATDNVATFAMPASNVTVSATFKEVEPTELWADGAKPAANQIFYTATDEPSLENLYTCSSYDYSNEFSNGKGIITFEVEEITSIEDYTFKEESNFTSVILPDEVTTVGEYAFADCISLESVTMSNVTSIGDYAFYGCESLGNADMPKVTSIGDYAFNDCTSLANVTMPEVTSIGECAFNDCSSLTSVSMPEATSIGENAFSGCGIEDIDMPKVTSIGNDAFSYCSSLISVTMPEITNVGTDVFFCCDNLKFVYAPSGVSSALASNSLYPITVATTANGTIAVNDMETVDGCDCYVLAGQEIDLNCIELDSGYEFGKFSVNGTEIEGDTFTMPNEAVTLSATFKAVVTDPEFYAVYNTAAEGTKVAYTLSFYYDTNKSSHTGETVTIYENLPTNATKLVDWKYYDKRGQIKNVVIDSSVAGYTGLQSTSYMFDELSYAENISGCEYLNVSNVTNMSYMFCYYGGNVKTLTAVPDVSGWNTSKVTNMADMFYAYAKSSTSINAVPDVSGWITSNVTTMESMFSDYAYNSTEINAVPDVSGWDTSKVTNMAYMFIEYAYNSTAITEVPNVSGWITGEVTNMASLFESFARFSTAITKVPDVSGWNTSKVTNMSGTFKSYGRASKSTLKPLDLSGWDISALTNAESMFLGYGQNNASNPIIYAKDWSTLNTSVTESTNMFKNSKLKGTLTGNWASANTSETGCFTAKPPIEVNAIDENNLNEQQETEKAKIVEKLNDQNAILSIYDVIYKENGTIVREPATLQSFNITIDMEGKCNLRIFRYHDNGNENPDDDVCEFTKISSTDTPTDGTYIVTGSGSETTITAYSNKFSMVVATYSEIPTAVANAKYSASLTLKDNINVNFKINNISDAELSKLKVYVDGVEQTITLTNGVASGAIKAVTPDNMSKNIHFVATYEDESGTAVEFANFEYSIVAYCNSAFEAANTNPTKYAKLASLCKAVLNYGYYAEMYQNGKSGITLGDNAVDFSTVTVDAPTASTPSETATASITLGSKISMTYYVKTEKDLETLVGEDKVVVVNNLEKQTKVDPENVDIVKLDSEKDGYDYKIIVKNINASQLGRVYTLRIDDEDIFNYGVYNYCSDAQNQASFSNTTKTLCKAVYNYGVAAADYTQA